MVLPSKVTPFVKFTSLPLYPEAENLHNWRMNFVSPDIFVIIKDTNRAQFERRQSPKI